MTDNFTTVWNRIMNRAPDCSALLCQQFVRDSFQQLQSRREWSWLVKTSTFYPSVFYQTGTISISPGSQTVTGVGTAWDQTMVQCQIRSGSPPSSLPTYTILAVNSATSLLIDRPWIGPAQASASYQIFQCYMAVPADFADFISLVSVTNNYRLHTNVTQMELDLCDAQRVQQTGISYAASFYDYTQNYSGNVGPVVQVVGTGPVPVSGNTGYSYPASATYVVAVSTGGQPGAGLAFTWKQDSGSFSSPVAVSNSNAIALSNGVTIAWPSGTYVLNDTFVISAFPLSAAAQARYELWPRPIANPFVYPYLYRCRLPELTDASPALPPTIADRGDVLLEMSLANAARTPGTAERPNPYFNLTLALQHDARAEKMLTDLENRDDEIARKDLSWQNWPFAPAPWMDGQYLQQHGWPNYPSFAY